MNRQLYLVAYPVLTEVGGVVLDEDGTRVAGPQQAATAEELVERLAAAPAIDPTVDIVVVPGWDKAPDGLRASYEARRGPNTRTVLRALTDEDEELIEEARRALGS